MGKVFFRRWLLFCMFISAHGVFAEPLCKTIRVATHPHYPPFHYWQDNEIKGPSVSITETLSADLNVSVRWAPQMPWKRVLAEVSQGNIDMVMGLKDSADRKAYMLFSDVPVFANPMSVFVKTESASAFQTWIDLIGKTGTISAGDQFGDEFDRFAGQFLTLQTAPDPVKAMQMLELGRSDYVVMGRLTGQQVLQDLHSNDSTISAPILINSGFVYLGMSKTSDCAPLMPEINQLLKKYLFERRFDVGSIIGIEGKNPSH